MKQVAPTLRQLSLRLEAQAAEMATLRAELEVQFTRIANMQLELDLSRVSRRRQTPGAPLSTAASRNGRHRSRN